MLGICEQFSNLVCVNHMFYYTPSQRGNYHHSKFHNPTAPVNLFHVGKQYLTLCKAEAAVTHNLIGRKIISNVKHADGRNSLPMFRRHTLKSQTPQCVRVLQINATSNDRCLLYAYMRARRAISLPTECRQEAAVVSREHRMKRVVILGDCYQWPLPWECNVLYKGS